MNPPDLLDLLLVLYLLILSPGRDLWRSMRPPGRPSAPRLQRYRKNIAGIAILLAALVASTWAHGRTAADLGLAMPLSGVGLWCLGISATVLLALCIGGEIWERGLAPDKRAAQQASIKARLESTDSLPRTHEELRLFAVQTLFVACGWELLYRGFLLLVLAPVTGVPGAVILSAMAYGAGHGYRNIKQFSANIVSAFMFTIAYALTHSLWWLMLIHIAMGMLGAIASARASRSEPTVEVNTV